MKILYYSPHPVLHPSHNTGYGTHMREVITAFKQKGIEVIPVINGRKTKQKEQSSNRSSTKSKVKSILKGNLKTLSPLIIWETIKDLQLLLYDTFFYFRLLKIARSERPDLIYERGSYLQLSGIKTAKKLMIFHILEVNCPTIEERIEFQGKSLLLNKAFKTETEKLSQTDMVISISLILSQFLIKKHLTQPAEKFLVLPNAVSQLRFKDHFANEVALKNHYKIHPRDIVIGFVGSTLKWHKLEMLIKSFSEIKKVHTDVKLLIVGGGEMLTHLKQVAQQEDAVANDIIFTGDVFHPFVFNYISIMDITVLPGTNWYCSPIKLFEYALMGKAIIAFKTNAVEEFIKHGKNGFLIDEYIVQLKEAIIQLISDEVLRKQIGTEARKNVLDQFLWNQYVDRILEKKQKRKHITQYTKELETQL